MPAGLDTGLQVVHYLARRLNVATNLDFARGVGVLLGEISPNSNSVAFQFLCTTVFTPNTVLMLLSLSPDLSSPFQASVALSAVGNVPFAAQINGALDYTRSGKIYVGLSAPATVGAGIVSIRFLPRVDPLALG